MARASKLNEIRPKEAPEEAPNLASRHLETMVLTALSAILEDTSANNADRLSAAKELRAWVQSGDAGPGTRSLETGKQDPSELTLEQINSLLEPAP